MAVLTPEHLKDAFCGSLQLLPQEDGRFVIDTPFSLVGGDHVPIVLKEGAAGWELTDDGETFMQLDLLVPNFDEGRRWQVIETVLASHGVKNHEGALTLTVDPDAPADSLAHFVQAMVEVMDVRHWTREVVRETFREDARRLVETLRPDARFGYHDPEHDPEGRYLLDALIPGARDVGILFVGNDEQCAVATISLHMFERWDRKLDSVVIFGDQETIARKPLARLSDVAGKLFSSLATAKERLPALLTEVTA